MGAFFLQHRDTKINVNALRRHFGDANFSDPLIADLNEYRLYHYKKQEVKTKNYIFHEGFNVFACGSLFYKGSGYTDSLEKLLYDYTESRIEWEELFGNYVLLFYNKLKNHIDLYTDPSVTKFVYADTRCKIISSSFLSIAAAEPQKYSLKEVAVLESIISGNLIGPDTYFNEIIKIDKENISTIDVHFKGITTGSETPLTRTHLNNKLEAVDHANHTLSDYFSKIAAIANEYGTHIGLTGGLDSRLLLMHAKDKINALITNSFWRPDSREFQYAKALARAAGIDFVSFEEHPFVITDIKEQLKTAYVFFDGQIRSQNYWSEEFNNPDYIRQISNKHLLGFHGCGGEQYRNSDRFSGRLSLRDFIRYEWMFKWCTNAFLDKQWEQYVFENIRDKITRMVDIPERGIGLYEMKKIQNEIWNNANRTTRLNAINQQQFYFAPFTEYSISHGAYNYIPFLGGYADFELEMMRRLKPELLQVPTIYGPGIFKGESLAGKARGLLYNALPRKLSNAIYLKLKKIKSASFESTLGIEQDILITHRIDRIIDLNIIARNKVLGKNLDSLIYFLNNMDAE